MLCVALSGCTLGTPGTTVTVMSECPSAIGVSLGFMAVEGKEEMPAAVDSEIFENTGVLLEDPDDTRTSLIPTLTEDVDEVFLEVTVDSGGDFGLWFVVALPVKAIDEYEYELLDGPVVIAGDRCPQP